MSIWVKFKNWFWGDLKEPEPDARRNHEKLSLLGTVYSST